MNSRKRVMRREWRLRKLGLACLVLVGICLLPVLLGSMEGLGQVALAAPLLGGIILRDPHGEGGGGTGTQEPPSFEARVLGGITELKTELKGLKEKAAAQEKVIQEQAQHIVELRKARLTPAPAARLRSRRDQEVLVSDGCARSLGAAFVIGNARNGRLDLLDAHVRGSLFTQAKSILGLETKDAITTTDIPLPIEYFSEVRELISDFGVARRKMFPFPIGRGTAKPPRFKTRPTFGSIAMSAAFTEKSPQIDFAALESHKIGGIVRLPREIDEQSIVAMGQFLARYGAVEFARAEDTWAFLADGTATYESVKGICKIASDNAKVLTLAAGKTKPSDVTKGDLRNLRTKVNKAALSAARSAYYLDSTWETALRDFNTEADPNFFVIMPDGSAKIDGYPVIWTDVLTPYGTAAAASSYLAVFGALDYWWFGEHGSPRMDFSSDVYFASDELATRFIEEIDFDYQQVDVTAALATPAA